MALPLLTLARIVPLALVLATGAGAQAGGQWGALPAGPHRIGYRTFQVTDSSRRYFDGPRTIQVYAWYPASPRPATTRMPYGGYFDDAALDWGRDSARVAFLQKRARDGFLSGALNPSFPAEFHRRGSTRFSALRRRSTGTCRWRRALIRFCCTRT